MGSAALSLKKVQKTVERVKADVRELTEAVWALRDEVITHQAASAAASQPGAARPAATSAPLELQPPPADSAGYVTTNGFARLPEGADAEREYRWDVEQLPVEQVIALPVDDTARLLGAIGHRQRLRITLRLLSAPATASDIVHELSLGTTGAAYHHLNVLQGAGLVEQEHRGTFSIAPAYVPTLLSIFAGLSDAMSVTITDSAHPVEE